MSEKTTTLLLFDELARQSKRPLYVTDLLSYMRATVDRNLWPQPGPELRRRDPSDLFLVLNRLETEGYVEQTPRGYVLTRRGHRSAKRTRSTLSPDVRKSLDELASVA